jgi:hypothetical protein
MNDFLPNINNNESFLKVYFDKIISILENEIYIKNNIDEIYLICFISILVDLDKT